MFPSPLTLTIMPSAYLGRGLVALHVLALTATWMAQLSWIVQVIVSLLLVGKATLNQRRQISINTIRCSKEGQLSLITGSGDRLPLRLVAIPLLLPDVVMLRFRTTSSQWPKTLLLISGSLPGQDFRRFRIWLRWISQKRLEGTTLVPVK